MTNGSQEHVEDPVESLTGVHNAIICALGDHVGVAEGVPLDADTVLSRFPEPSRAAFRLLAAGNFPGKERARPEIALIEFLCGPFIEVSQSEGKVGFRLSEPGKEHFREIIAVYESESVFPEAQPADHSLVGDVGAVATAAVRAA